MNTQVYHTIKINPSDLLLRANDKNDTLIHDKNDFAKYLRILRKVGYDILILKHTNNLTQRIKYEINIIEINGNEISCVGYVTFSVEETEDNVCSKSQRNCKKINNNKSITTTKQTTKVCEIHHLNITQENQGNGLSYFALLFALLFTQITHANENIKYTCLDDCTSNAIIKRNLYFKIGYEQVGLTQLMDKTTDGYSTPLTARSNICVPNTPERIGRIIDIIERIKMFLDNKINKQ